MKATALAPMAVKQWSELPTDVILLIAKILSSDVDTIRLRSICSNWRSSIRRRYRPSSFPLQVPPLFCDRASALREGTRSYLHYTTIYRLSPPEFGPCAGDPSEGFLLRVSEVRPNTFSVLSLLSRGIPESDSTLALKRVNLLDFRVSEIRKSYVVESVNWCSNDKVTRTSKIARAIVIWNWDVDCVFAVVVLRQGVLHRWKFGDPDWIAIDCFDLEVNHFCFQDGKCYAIGDHGLLLVVDSKFNVTVPSLPRLPVYPDKVSNFFLMGYKSELYVLSITSDESESRGDAEVAAEMKIFKKGNRSWEHIKCLGDKMFLFCHDVIVGLSSKDFNGCKDNCVYFSPDHFSRYGRHGKKIEYAEYDLDEDRTLVRKWGEEAHTVICRPPPKWLLSS